MMKIFCCLACSFLFLASVVLAQEKNEPGNKNKLCKSSSANLS
jgi:hypothetical protein